MYADLESKVNSEPNHISGLLGCYKEDKDLYLAFENYSDNDFTSKNVLSDFKDFGRKLRLEQYRILIRSAEKIGAAGYQSSPTQDFYFTYNKEGIIDYAMWDIRDISSKGKYDNKSYLYSPEANKDGK